MLAIDLYCGLGGWSEGLLAEGWDVTGFDIERHEYDGEKYPAQLVLQDVLTIHGKQFKDVDLIVASPPCQKYSYMAMPWSKAKEMRRRYLDPHDDEYSIDELNALFNACFRIQREACEAAGRHIPMIVENVRGAQEWVGRSRWNFGSFHLWGDVPALMPMPQKQRLKYQSSCSERMWKDREVQRLNDGVKAHGMNWSDRSKRGQDFTRIAGKQAGIKGSDGYERKHQNAFGWKKPGTSSKSAARKAASAKIAKIPFPLSQHIAQVFKPIEAA